MAIAVGQTYKCNIYGNKVKVLEVGGSRVGLLRRAHETAK